MNETVSLQQLFMILRRSLWRIAVLTIGFALVAFAVSAFLLEPVYQADTQILVTANQQKNQNVDALEVQSAVTLVNTYRVIIKSPAILEKVQQEIPKAPDTPRQLGDMITVESEQDSQVINVSVQDTDPRRAASIANAIGRVFSEDIRELMNVDNVKVLSMPVIPDEPISPNVVVNTAVAGIVGLLVGIGIAFLREVLDRRIRTEEQVQRLLALTVLGSVPDTEGKFFRRTKRKE